MNPITYISNFISSIQGSLRGGPIGSVSQVAFIIWGLVAIGLFFRMIYVWNEKGHFWKEFFAVQGRVTLLYFVVALAPLTFQTMGYYCQGQVSGAMGRITKVSSLLFDNLYRSVLRVTDVPGIQMAKFRAAHPLVTSGDTNFDSSIRAAEGRVSQLQAEATLAKQAAESGRSKDPKKAEAVVAEAEKALSEARTTLANLKALQKAQDDGIPGWLKTVLLTLLGPLGRILQIAQLLGTGFFWVISWIAVAIPLYMGGSSLVKMVSGAISLFSGVLTTIVIVSLATATGVVLAPLALLALASQHTKSYGHAYITWWLSALLQTTTYAAAVGIVCAGIGALAAGLSGAVANFVNLAAGTAEWTELCKTGLYLGLFYMATGGVLDLLKEFLTKVPNAIGGLVTGTFHIA